MNRKREKRLRAKFRNTFFSSLTSREASSSSHLDFPKTKDRLNCVFFCSETASAWGARSQKKVLEGVMIFELPISCVSFPPFYLSLVLWPIISREARVFGFVIINSHKLLRKIQKTLSEIAGLFSQT